MSKKQETKKVEVEEAQIKEEAVSTVPVVEQLKAKTITVEKLKRKEPTYKKAEDGWEIKDRIYRLKGGKKPLSRSIRSANIHWFDEEKGYERELKYCQNQKTVFVDEMKGDQRMEHIVFRNGRNTERYRTTKS